MSQELKTCATCKWWWYVIYRDNVGYAYCQAADIGPFYGTEVIIEVDEPNIGAHLLTREDFGCVLHEGKEKNV